MTVGLLVHAFAAVIWVGGMFFAYMVLRPATGALDPHVRLDLWGQVFVQFFPWVWASIVALLVSGYGISSSASAVSRAPACTCTSCRRRGS